MKGPWGRVTGRLPGSGLSYSPRALRLPEQCSWETGALTASHLRKLKSLVGLWLPSFRGKCFQLFLCLRRSQGPPASEKTQVILAVFQGSVWVDRWCWPPKVRESILTTELERSNLPKSSAPKSGLSEGTESALGLLEMHLE